MTIELITFDLDDTLWDTAPVIASAEAVLRQWLTDNAPTLGSVPVEHLFTIREQVLREEPGLKHRISALRRRVLFRALQDAGYDQWQASELADEARSEEHTSELKSQMRTSYAVSCLKTKYNKQRQ